MGALVNGCILTVHGGIGRYIESPSQIATLERPLRMGGECVCSSRAAGRAPQAWPCSLLGMHSAPRPLPCSPTLRYGPRLLCWRPVGARASLLHWCPCAPFCGKYLFCALYVSHRHAELLLDLLWSDPTASDDVLGVHTNEERGAPVVCFGPDRVHSFLRDNGLSLIIRAHEVIARSP